MKRTTVKPKVASNPIAQARSHIFKNRQFKSVVGFTMPAKLAKPLSQLDKKHAALQSFTGTKPV